MIFINVVAEDVFVLFNDRGDFLSIFVDDRRYRRGCRRWTKNILNQLPMCEWRRGRRRTHNIVIVLRGIVLLVVTAQFRLEEKYK